MNPGASIRILYLEDDPGLARLFQKRLERAGYEVTIARDGREGLALCEAEHFDIIATDQQMPGLAGLEVLRLLAARVPAPATLMITGAGNEAIAVEAMKLGAADYIIKDVEGRYLELLPALIEKVLHQQRLIRERNQAEQARRESEEKYRNLVELARDGIAIIQDQRLRYVNPQSCEMTGFTEAELVGQPFMDYIEANQLEEMESWYSRLMAGEAVPFLGETALRHKSGRAVPVEYKMSWITYQDRPAGMLILRDLTFRRQVEEEQRKIQRLEALGTLAGGIAHDFNNILTGILGCISLAKVRFQPSEKVYQVLDRAQGAAEKAAELANQLITFSSGGRPVKRRLAIAGLLAETVRVNLDGTRLRSSLRLADDLREIEADPGQLRQVCVNILANAREALPPDGQLEIGAENVLLGSDGALPVPAGHYLRIWFRDWGSGIAAPHLPRVFDPFFTTKEVGRGLGLAAAYSIVKNHAGCIRAESEPGAGAPITVYLPAVAPGEG